MDAFVAIFLSIQAFVYLGLAIAIVYLIFRRLKLKKEEDFEKRDN